MIDWTKPIEATSDFPRKNAEVLRVRPSEPGMPSGAPTRPATWEEIEFTEKARQPFGSPAPEKSK
jgi:hypothetical protein